MNTRINVVRTLVTLAATALLAGGCDVEDEEFLEEMEALEEMDDLEFRDFGDLEVRHGKFKMKLTNTTADKWKVKWKCNTYDAEGNYVDNFKVDADQFPGSGGATREANMSEANCPSGKWRAYLYIKEGGDWQPVTPSGEASVCGDGNWSCGYFYNGEMRYYVPNDHFNNSNKICLKSWWALGSYWAEKVGC